jgi:subtilase family serine protease
LNNATHVKPTYDGTGTTIAIVPTIYYSSSDVDFFWQYFGITRTGTIGTVLVNGGGGTTADAESTLDVEQIGSQAPGANIVGYSVPGTVTNNGFSASVSFTDIELAFSQAVTDNTADTISTSVVGCEAVVGNIQSIESVLQQGVAQGITFFVGTGDTGAYAQEGGCSGTSLAVDYPSSSQYETAVGGTTLNLSGNNRYSSETAWSLSGGGQSTFIAQPSWEQVPGVPANGTRNIADVAFDADPNTGYYEYFLGGWYFEGGTSFGGPNWAALWVLGVQALNGARTGNAAPSIYQIGGNDHHTYSSTFHDVTNGNNGFYNATTGWDYPTGWGSPNGAHLVNWIKKHL